MSCAFGNSGSLAHPLSFAVFHTSAVLSFLRSLNPNVLFWINNPQGMQIWGLLGAGHEVLSNFSRRTSSSSAQRSSCTSFWHTAPVRYLLPDSNARGAISVKILCRDSAGFAYIKQKFSYYFSTRKRWYESAWPGASFWRGASSDALPLASYITYPAVSDNGPVP